MNDSFISSSPHNQRGKHEYGKRVCSFPLSPTCKTNKPGRRTHHPYYEVYGASEHLFPLSLVPGDPQRLNRTPEQLCLVDAISFHLPRLAHLLISCSNPMTTLLFLLLQVSGCDDSTEVLEALTSSP